MEKKYDLNVLLEEESVGKWKSTIEVDHQGKEKAFGVSGGKLDDRMQDDDVQPLTKPVDATTNGAPGMHVCIDNGPTASYTGKKGAGWTGTKALSYQGKHTAEGRAYSYNKISEVDIDVTTSTKLSYLIHPEFADEAEFDYSSTFVAVDLLFSDGTYLSELQAKDQYGFPLTPQSQGEENILYPNQWNYKAVAIGEVAAGKTIKRILIAYDNPQGPGEFKGSVDDIKIDSNPVNKVYESAIDYVNILRGTNANGTFSRGNNFPAVAVPHGFNFWTPVTDAGSVMWLYSYQEQNNEDNLPELEAFSLSHETSPWMGDRQTFQIMPSALKRPSANRTARSIPFKHENEVAHPHYYSVTFENGIQTEITPTNRAAMFKFTFTDEQSSLIFDNVTNEGGLSLDADNNTITGYTDVMSGLSNGATRMFVYASFDSQVTDCAMLTGEERDDVAGYCSFDTSNNKTVIMKIATSLISVEQAQKNLEQDIKPTSTFESLKNKAKALWEEKLNIISVDSASDEELTTLYSNMYRLFLYPNIMYENIGTDEEPHYVYASAFSDPNSKSSSTKTGANIKEGKPYVNNGFWDTYRTTWPAYALFTPNHAGKMIDGFVQQYRDGGWISRWSSPGYADLMVGTSSDVAFADAYLKGVTNFDVKSFYDASIKNAAVSSDDASVGRKGLATSIFDGYTNRSTDQGLSWAMDGYINDFGISNIAKHLAEQGSGNERKQYETDGLYYRNRAQNYVNLFNSEVDFFMGKTAVGKWWTSAEDFNPDHWGGDYTETNAWNMAFHAPQDGQGLANLYGGRDKLAKRLDEFFIIPEKSTGEGYYGGLIHEMREARDVRMGMYAHSNQPSHHIVYMYNYAGQPWKTQEKVREILSRLYIGSEIGQGYPGDEDNGEMSTWYLFSAAGFYPLQMGLPEYAIGAPYFEKMTIRLENGKEIVINAPDVSSENKYVQSLTVNGKPYNKTTISHALLAAGAVLNFEMGSKPSDWGTGQEALPKSIANIKTDGTILDVDPLKDLATLNNGTPNHSDGEAATALFDNTSDTELTLSGANPWVKYTFTNGARKVEMYTITSGSNEAQDPKRWALMGSNDGEAWTVLDEQTDVAFKWRKFTQPFLIENPGKYKFYKLNMSGNQSTSHTTISEIELLGYSDVEEKIEKLEQNYQAHVEKAMMSKALNDKLVDAFKASQKSIELNKIEEATQPLLDVQSLLENDQVDKIDGHVKKQIQADIHALIDAIKA